jgi:hypothetical protein
LSFFELASELAVFACVTEPPFPPLPTRMSRFVFVGASWNAWDSASAACEFSADCVEVWIPPAPPCVCDASCEVSFEFVAVPVESTEFVCETFPSFPGLSTRTLMFVLLGLTCVASDAAAACCPLAALWSTVCTPGGVSAAAVVALTASIRTSSPTNARNRLDIYFSLVVVPRRDVRRAALDDGVTRGAPVGAPRCRVDDARRRQQASGEPAARSPAARRGEGRSRRARSSSQ